MTLRILVKCDGNYVHLILTLTQHAHVRANNGANHSLSAVALMIIQVVFQDIDCREDFKQVLLEAFRKLAEASACPRINWLVLHRFNCYIKLLHQLLLHYNYLIQL